MVVNEILNHKKNLFLNYFPTCFLILFFIQSYCKGSPFPSLLLLLPFDPLLFFLILPLFFLILVPICCWCLELQMAPTNESRLSTSEVLYLETVFLLHVLHCFSLPLLLSLYLCAGSNCLYPAEAESTPYSILHRAWMLMQSSIHHSLVMLTTEQSHT